MFVKIQRQVSIDRVAHDLNGARRVNRINITDTGFKKFQNNPSLIKIITHL